MSAYFKEELYNLLAIYHVMKYPAIKILLSSVDFRVLLSILMSSVDSFYF